MKLKLAVFLVLFAAIGGSAFGQGVIVQPRTVFGTVNGVTRPVPGATITVCAATTAGLPCSPALPNTLFKDVALTQPLSNPFPADANGNYQFAVAAGTYTVTETAAGYAGYSYQLSVACSIGACTINNLTATGTVTLSGQLNLSGTGTFSTDNTFSGNNTFNNAHGNALNDLTVGIINRTRWNCSNGTGYRFGTIEAALSDVQTNATQGGYIWTCPDNSTDSTPGQVEIGSATKTAAVELHPGNQWLDNNSTSHTYSWGIHNGSTLVGANNGTIGVSRTGGAYLKYGCSANSSYGLTTPEGVATTPQAYALFQHVSMEGCPTGTVGAGSPSIAMINWEGISNMNTISDVQVFNFANTYGIRFASNNPASLGPIAANNLWSDGSYNAGNKPAFAGNTSGACGSFNVVTDIAGTYAHPGSGLNIYEINGEGCNPSQFYGLAVIGKYTENQQNGSTSHYFIKDANNVNLFGIESGTKTTDTMVNIASESFAGSACDITVIGHANASVTLGATNINNAISGVSQSGKKWTTFYHYGGDSSCSITPFTIDSNNINLLNGSLQFGGTTADATFRRDAANIIGLHNLATAQIFNVYKTTDAGIANYQRFAIDTTAANVTLATQHAGTGVASGIQLNPDSGVVNVQSNGTTEFQFNGSTFLGVLAAGTKIQIGTISANGPTATLSGTGACATFSGQVGGKLAGSAACASATAASTLTIGGLPAATNGYSCSVQDETTRANLFQQTSHTTTSCVLTATSVTQNDVFVFTAIGF